MVDTRPFDYKSDPQGFWDGLAKRMADGDMRAAQIYSTLKAAEGLNALLWWHVHRAGHPTEIPVVFHSFDLRQMPPYCCNYPMWSRPSGWHCRINKTSFDYQ